MKLWLHHCMRFPLTVGNTHLENEVPAQLGPVLYTFHFLPHGAVYQKQPSDTMRLALAQRYSLDQTRASCREDERPRVWPDWTACRGLGEMAAGETHTGDTNSARVQMPLERTGCMYTSFIE